MFSSDDVAKIIRDLDLIKAHGHDMISIPMFKICSESIWKPLEIIFKSCIKKGQFSDNQKEGNVVPVHKKGDKQVVRNYRPVSLLPMCTKMFKRLVYNKLFEFFIKKQSYII